jgi:hypothetical protein
MPFDPSQGEGSVQGQCLLKSSEGLEFLTQLEYNCSAADAEMRFGGSVRRIYDDLMNTHPKHAHLITPMPPVFGWRAPRVRDVRLKNAPSSVARVALEGPPGGWMFCNRQN